MSNYKLPPTKNQTEENAKNWLNQLIKEKDIKETINTIRYNLQGKNPYYRFNNIYDEWLIKAIYDIREQSGITNKFLSDGGMMADGGDTMM